MFENYEKYLEFIQSRINSYFKNQSEYISCKKGCSKCCKNAHFPYSELEFRYLISNFLNLDEDLKKEIGKNIYKTKKEKDNSGDEHYRYDCPFLVNDECILYNYRGITCRTFGLITSASENSNAKIPFCSGEGLNYSNVYDEKTKILSYKKFKELKLKEEPLGFNISYDFLTGERFEKTFDISFGEKKYLIDWFKLK